MFGLRPKLPVTEEQRLWVDEGFRRLARAVGHDRMLHARVILPDDEFFPDRYDGTESALQPLFARVCEYMGVDRSQIDVEVFPDHTEELKKIVPYWRGGDREPAGLYMRDGNESRMVVALRSTQLKDPLTLVATIAHELGHVILLGGGCMARSESDMEPITDLLTVYLGMGIFNANSCAQFQQYESDDGKHGWSTRKLGYLSEEIYGYALAKFAAERREERPPWAKHLSANIATYFSRSSKWLRREGAASYPTYS
jgi:hypothetical protein